MGIIRGMFVSVVAMAAILVAILGCAKDQTLEDYQNQKVLDDVAKYQAVAGRYSGLIKNQDGIPLGGLEVRLKALLSTSGGSSPVGRPGSSGASTAGSAALHATLTTEVHFRDLQTAADLRTSSGSYDPASGVYEADFEIPMVDGNGNPAPSRQLSITGNINDGHIRGTMQGVGFDTQSTALDLARNGLPLNDLGKLSKPVPGSLPEGVATKFSGTVVWNQDPDDPLPSVMASKTKPPPKPDNIRMNAIYPMTSPNQHFLNLFLPDDVKSIEIDISYGVGGNITFSSGSWDTNSGNLIAQGTWTSISTGIVIRHLNCTGFSFIQTRAPFKCQFWTDRNPIVVMNFGPAEPVQPPGATNP
jgi:hypothetical protein